MSDDVKYHCDYCRRDISGEVRIKCAVCTDFDLCVECFSVGVEVTPHANSHAYQVLDRVNFPLFTPDWEAEEELLLLEAIEKYGLGNWQDVADHVGSKTPHQVASHYFEIYVMQNPETYMPPTHALLTSPDTLASAKAASEAKASSSGNARKKRKKVKAYSSAAGGSSKTISGRSGGGSGAGGYASAPVNYDMAGYMEQRREFEVEYNNDAEQVIANLVFTEEDTPEDVEAKYKLLEIYNQRLAERYQRREFVISRELMDFKRLRARERQMYKEDRELHLKLRPLLLVVSREDYEKFIDGLFRERSIRLRLKQLAAWRAAGIRTLEEGVEYESAVARRNEALKQHKVPVGETRSGSIVATSPYEREALFKKYLGQKMAKPKGKLGPLDISALPDAELLGKAEKALCAETRLYPRQYLVLKAVMLKDRPVHQKHCKDMFKVEQGKVQKVYEFMCRAGWLESMPGVPGPPGALPQAPAPQGMPGTIPMPVGVPQGRHGMMPVGQPQQPHPQHPQHMPSRHMPHPQQHPGAPGAPPQQPQHMPRHGHHGHPGGPPPGMHPMAPNGGAGAPPPPHTMPGNMVPSHVPHMPQGGGAPPPPPPGAHMGHGAAPPGPMAQRAAMMQQAHAAVHAATAIAATGGIPMGAMTAPPAAVQQHPPPHAQHRVGGGGGAAGGLPGSALGGDTTTSHIPAHPGVPPLPSPMQSERR